MLVYSRYRSKAQPGRDLSEAWTVAVVANEFIDEIKRFLPVVE